MTIVKSKHVALILYSIIVVLTDIYIIIKWLNIAETIFVNNQLDADSFSYICLFQFSTCFEQPCAHHLESLLYQYDLWYMSLYVGDRVTCTRGRTDTIDSPDDEHLVARNM